MKTIIAGSRSANAGDVWVAITHCPWEVTSVVSGGCREGADRHGEDYAVRKELPLQFVYAQWDEFGKSAGPIRNREMAAKAESLLAVWDGESRGTKNMIDCALSAGLSVYVWRIDLHKGMEMVRKHD